MSLTRAPSGGWNGGACGGGVTKASERSCDRATPAPTNIQWSMAGASGANLVTYAVRLKAWIYRL